MQKLNPQQEIATNSTARITYVDACAGSGKTTSIEAKIAKCLEDGVKPWNITVLAFNNKIVDDIKVRFSQHFGELRANKMKIHTFHSYALNILRRKKKKINLMLTNDSELRTFIKKTWNDYKKLHHIESTNRLRRKNKVEELFDMAKQCRENNSHRKHYKQSMKKFYKFFKERLIQTKTYDFARIIKVARDELEPSNNIQHIFVDEFQDTSEARFDFLTTLVGKDNYLYAVGDEDQQLLECFGVVNNNVAKLKGYYKDELCTYFLEYSHRLTPSLARRCNNLLASLPNRVRKIIIGMNNGKAEFAIKEFAYENNETKWCVNYIKSLMQKGVKPKDIAVLYHNNDMIKKEILDTGVHCSTIHKAKGLEFTYVIVLGVEEGILPRNDRSIEEDIRALYVAMSRSKQSLVLTYIKDGMRGNRRVSRSRLLDYVK